MLGWIGLNSNLFLINTFILLSIFLDFWSDRFHKDLIRKSNISRQLENKTSVEIT